MRSRAEVTARYADAYVRACKQDKGRILDQVCGVTGWSRDNARRRLRRKAARQRGPVVAPVARRPRPFGYSYDARKVLVRVWAASGGMCGKYLAVAMGDLLDSMQAHGHLPGRDGRYTPAVRVELEAMSSATVDRYLAPVRAQDPVRGKATTKPGSLLRTSITIRKAGDEVAAEPGFFEVDTVAHCGPTLKGEFARSVNFTDVNTGWVFTYAIRNNSFLHMSKALKAAHATIPYQVQGLDCDNGSEFINTDVISWAADLGIYFTRSRPYQKNDQATVESKNNHVVRRYGYYYRYDTPDQLKLLNALWRLVGDRLNYFTPTKKPTGWATDAKGRRRRLYDTPATPYDRLLASGVLSGTQEADLRAKKASLDPVHIARRIDAVQRRLLALAAAKTEDLRTQQTRPLPDPAGIKLTA